MIKTKIRNIHQKLAKYRNEYANYEKRQNKYKIGDVVWYYNKIAQVNKLESRWQQKGTIIAEGGKAYIIAMEDGRHVRANDDHMQKVGKCC